MPCRGLFQRMRHRLGLAQALLSEPQFYSWMNLPRLDPICVRIWRINLKLVKSGSTVLMSSHVLPEVEAICDIVGIFDHGQLVAMDTIEHLRSTASDSLNIGLPWWKPIRGS